MTDVLLAHLGVIRVTGSDRITFLQGQLTQDLGEFTGDSLCPWGWNNPKGRLITLGHGCLAEDAVLLLTGRELIDDMLARLRLFVLRADVRLSAAELAVATTPAGAAGALPLTADPAHALRLVTAGAEPPAAGAPALAGWELAAIRAGLPDINAATTGLFVPQMVNLDLLGGISFTKGCYVGQEVVARTQNLGRIKRRMLRFASPVAAAAGDELTDADGKAVARVVRAAPADTGFELLAVVQLAAAGAAVMLGDAQLAPLPLPYAIPELA